MECYFINKNNIKLNTIEALVVDTRFALDLLKGYCNYHVEKVNELASILYGLNNIIKIQDEILRKIDEIV